MNVDVKIAVYLLRRFSPCQTLFLLRFAFLRTHPATEKLTVAIQVKMESCQTAIMVLHRRKKLSNTEHNQLNQPPFWTSLWIITCHVVKNTRKFSRNRLPHSIEPVSKLGRIFGTCLLIKNRHHRVQNKLPLFIHLLCY